MILFWKFLGVNCDFILKPLEDKSDFIFNFFRKQEATP